MTWIIYEFPVNQKPRQSILMAMSTRHWAKHTTLHIATKLERKTGSEVGSAEAQTK